MKVLIYDQKDNNFDIFFNIFKDQQDLTCEFSTFLPKFQDYDLVITDTNNVNSCNNIRNIPIVVIGESNGQNKNQNCIYLKPPVVTNTLKKVVNSIQQYMNNHQLIKQNQRKLITIDNKIQKVWFRFSVNSEGILKFNKLINHYSYLMNKDILKYMDLIVSELVIDLFKNYREMTLNLIFQKDRIILQIHSNLSEYLMFFVKNYSDSMEVQDNITSLTWIL